MKHADAGALEALSDLLQSLRIRTALVERAAGDILCQWQGISAFPRGPCGSFRRSAARGRLATFPGEHSRRACRASRCHRPSQMPAHWAAARSARRSISSSVRVLSGWSMTTGMSSGMPSASRCTSASCRNSVVTTTAVGQPAASSLMPSCVQHDVHDPQSPIAVNTMSLLAATVAISTGSASLEKLSLR